MSGTTQQHTPCLDSEFTTALKGTSGMSVGNSLQPQQHAAGVGTRGRGEGGCNPCESNYGGLSPS